MPETRPGAALDEEEAPSELDLLVQAGDAAALVALARAHRTGAEGREKSMRLCHEAYEAAANLGSAEASYALALFAMQGGLGAQDWKAGAAHLRRAADAGHLDAKVYIANLYELGIHYAKDPAKADVWYRNAARQASIKDAVETEEFALAMAELGSAREYQILVEAGAVADEDKERLARRARLHGYELRARAPSEVARSDSFVPDAPRAPARKAAAKPASTLAELEAKTTKGRASGEEKVKAATPRVDKPARKATARSDASSVTFALGMVAFLYAIVFVATAAGAGYALTEGAKVLIAKSGPLPLLGKRVELIMPAAFFLLAFVPQFLFYKASAVMKALLAAGLASGLGWVAWGTGKGMFLPNQVQQSAGFAVAGFLTALLVVGVLGGAKAKQLERRPTVTLKRDEVEDPEDEDG